MNIIITVENDVGSKTKAPRLPIYLPDVDAKISEIVYYKAEKRNFAPGFELDDWLAAEQEFTL